MFEGKKSILLLVGLALSAATIFGAYMLFNHTYVSGKQMVIIDPVKISNAQRAYAAKIMMKKGKDDISPDSLDKLFQISKHMHEIIKERTKGKIVFVKQAIVSSDLPDITDEILKAAGLPTNPPTIDIGKALEMAPTMLMGMMPHEKQK
ncbi:hypothetical protein [Galenea microaerophila]